MFWTSEKLKQRIDELASYRYRDHFVIKNLKFRLDEAGEIGSRPDDEGVWEPTELGRRWEGRDLYAWIAADVEIPAVWAEHTIVGRFDFGRQGTSTNSGFEALLFLDGAPYQGVGNNHQEVFFPSELAGKSVSLRFRIWSGLEGPVYRGTEHSGKKMIQSYQLKRAELGWLDEAVDDVYFTGLAILQTVQVLSEHRPERQKLLSALDEAMNFVDWSKPGSERFYDSVSMARGALKARCEEMPKHHDVTVRCIGSTHIDVAWLWRLKHTREKCARSYSTALRLLEKYPEFIFMQSQPQLYDYLKSDYPELYAQIKERVREGRWESEGAMWLEADCNLTSGESLVRQILYGTRFFREEFGVGCTYLWLPDVFGYSWALPQILKKSGIEAFMTTKISWSQYNRMPHDTFMWRGLDGTEILAHFITTAEANRKVNHFTYNGKITAGMVQGVWDYYQDKSINQEMLLCYGHGDGGGGVTREMLEMRRRLADMPGLPKVETGRVDEYFAGLRDRVSQTEAYVHTWDGELYLELHRGTYTSQAYVKKMNRRLELLARETEWLGVLGHCMSKDWSHYRKEDLDQAWKIILRNQFHDIIPGTSIAEVYEDTKKEYTEAEELLLDMKASSEQALAAVSEVQQTGDRCTCMVANSAPWRRTDLVSIPLAPYGEDGRWLDTEGRELRAQVSGDQWLVKVEAIPSMGVAPITYHKGRVVEAPVKQSPFEALEGLKGIQTPYYLIEWNRKGQLIRIYDAEAKREVLEEHACGNVLQLFENKPLRPDSWGIDIYYQEKMVEVDQLESCSITEVGLLRAVIRFDWSHGDSRIQQDMIIYADSRRIDFVTHVDWHQREQLLKVAFPVAVRSTEATYDIQFGNVKRPTHWNTSWDQARFETVGQQWADLSERGYGVSLLNNCKYGYDIKDHVIRLTLLNAPMFPDPEMDRGQHEFTYALLPHLGSWLEGGTVQEAWELNNPAYVIPGTTKHEGWSLFSLSAEHVMIDAVKRAEDDAQALVVRLHEYAGARGIVELTSDFPIKAWQECDLMERPIKSDFEQAPISFYLKPYEIKTFLIIIDDAH